MRRHRPRRRAQRQAFEQLVAAVPFYAGLTLDEIAGHGVRWPERDAAADAVAARRRRPRPGSADDARPSRRRAATDGALALGTYRPIWAAPEVEISPSLQYLIAEPAGRALARRTRARLGIADGDEVVVARTAPGSTARAASAPASPTGTAFLAERDRQRLDSANARSSRAR